MQEEFMDSFEDPTPITIEDFEVICKEYSELRDTRDQLQLQCDAYSKQIKGLEEKIKSMLDAVDKPGYASKYGKVFTITKQRVSVPQGEDRKKFFEYLREQNLFDEVATVNSMWLNGYYRKEVESANERGEMVNIPGIGQPYTDIGIGFRKK